VPGDVKGAMLRFDTPYRLHGRAPGSVPIGFGSVLRAGGTAENAVAEDRIGRAEGSVAGIRTSALLGLAAAWFGQQLQGNPEIIYAQT